MCIQKLCRFAGADAPTLGKECALTRHVLVLACLAVITITYTWPLIQSLTTSIPGTPNDHDVATMVWNVDWVRRALNGHASLFWTDMVIVPFGADLRLHTYGLLQGLIAYPFTESLGVVGGYNLALVTTLFLNGVMSYTLVLRQVRQALPALVAAAWLMLGTPLLFHFRVGRPAFAAIWIVMGALLAAGSLLDQPRTFKGISLGLLLVAALLTDFQIVLFAVLWLSLYVAYRFWRDRRVMLERSRVLAMLLAGLIFAIPFAMIYYPALSGAEAAGYPRIGLANMVIYSFRFWDYMSPEVIPYAYCSEFLLAAFGGVLLFRSRGEYKFWLVSAIAFLILALGPYLQPWEIPLPFAAFKLLPILGQFRTPARLTIPALIGFEVVAGLVLAFVLTRIHSRLILFLGSVDIWGIVGGGGTADVHRPFTR